jgi:hypothetical protein
VVAGATLSPAFAAASTAYTAGPGLLPDSVLVTANLAFPTATMKVNGVAAASGVPTIVALPPGNTTVTIVVTAQNFVTTKTYTVVVTRDGPTAQEAYVKASNTGAGDNFGMSMAISGDTLVVGANGEASAATGINTGPEGDNTLQNSGAVYVFVRTGTTWTQQANIKASTTDEHDVFGSSVAIDGDTLVVGAPGEDSDATGPNPSGAAQSDDDAEGAGAAYVFVRSGTTWTQQAYLKASNTDAQDAFGTSVAVSGNTVAVGARHERSNATGVNPGTTGEADDSLDGAGAVYVFVRSGTTWTQEAYVKASNTDGADMFGESLALDGNTLVVGARGERSAATGVNPGATAEADDTADGAGAAYVFVRTGSTWAQEAYLKASNTGPGDAFGFSVAVSGNTLAIGAEREKSAATGINGGAAAEGNDDAASAGAAYVFVRSGSTWTQEAYVKASNTDVNDRFGFSVALSADSLLVGAFGEASQSTGVNPGSGAQDDDNRLFAGAAYLFLRTGTTWTQHAYLKASNTDEGDGLGWSVAIAGNTLLATARTEQSNATGVNPGVSAEADDSLNGAGAVYVYR